jgi:transposase-like protein
LRPRVIADVAKELGVSARIVERAWKQFRAHARRFAAGLRTDE